MEDRSKVFLGKKTLEIDSGTKFTSLRKRSSKQSRFEFDRSNRSGEIGAFSFLFVGWFNSMENEIEKRMAESGR